MGRGQGDRLESSGEATSSGVYSDGDITVVSLNPHKYPVEWALLSLFLQMSLKLREDKHFA